MKKNLVPLLGIAFVVAIISTGVFYGLFVGRLKNIAATQSSHKIVVAAKSLDRAAVLQETDLKLVPWPDGELPKGSYEDIAQVVGFSVLDPIQENEPVTQSRAGSRTSGRGAGLGIPSGMRAVSIHAADSGGVIALLRAGHRVDVQVFAVRTESAETELKTVLQNMEVLSVQGQVDPATGRGAPLPVVTLIAKPSDADVLAIADSGAKVRLLLRNPFDDGRSSLARMGVGALFNRTGTSSGPAPALASSRSHSDSPSQRDRDGQVKLWIRVAGAGPKALDELARQLTGPSSAEVMRVSAFRPGADLEAAVRQLEQKREMQVFSDSHLVAEANRSVSMRPGARACGLRIQFSAATAKAGGVRLRVEPEITTSLHDRVSTTRVATEMELADGQSFLVTGWLESAPAQTATLARLFPGRISEGSSLRELLILVTPQLIHSPLAASAGKELSR